MDRAVAEITRPWENRHGAALMSAVVGASAGRGTSAAVLTVQADDLSAQESAFPNPAGGVAPASGYAHRHLTFRGSAHDPLLD
ncbi:hypothetical protein KBI5_08450 [Frankia sp. KB5]|nr:hypothetical protein KBI5_08450 [Frankia sp. KB5]